MDIFTKKKDKKDKKSKKHDSSSEEDEDFEDFSARLEEKIEKSSSKKTSKLIELQSKFAYDKRFVVDERFVDEEEDGEDDDNDDQPKKKKVKGEDEDEVDATAEKSQNLSILEHVLGKQIQSPTKTDHVAEFRKSQVSSKASKAFTSVLVPRFDPSKAESKQFEIEAKTGSLDPNKKLNIDFDELDRREAEAKRKESERKRKEALKGPLKTSGLPVAEGESFFEVNANLKDAFGDTSDFTFDLFKEPEEDVHALNERAQEVPLETGRKKIFGLGEKNPFKYDSSSEDEDEPEVGDEDDEEEEGEGESKPEVKPEVTSVQVEATSGPQRKERKRVPVIEFTGFFFKKHDARLTQEVFWSPEVAKKCRDDAQGRLERMRAALRLRKKASAKNAQLKKRIEKKRVTMNPKAFKASMAVQKSRTGRGRKFRKNFNRK